MVGSSGGMEGDFTLSLMDGWSELTGGAKKMMKGRKASGQAGKRVAAAATASGKGMCALGVDRVQGNQISYQES